MHHHKHMSVCSSWHVSVHNPSLFSALWSQVSHPRVKSGNTFNVFQVPPTPFKFTPYVWTSHWQSKCLLLHILCEVGAISYYGFVRSATAVPPFSSSLLIMQLYVALCAASHPHWFPAGGLCTVCQSCKQGLLYKRINYSLKRGRKKQHST